MRRAIPAVLLTSCGALFFACPPSTSPSAAADAGVADSGSESATDGGDAGPVDAGPVDAGPPDSGSMAVTDAGPDGGACTTMLPGTEGSGMACRTCARNACASQVMTAETDCSGYDQCVCQCQGQAGCMHGCESQITLGCESDVMTVIQCSQQACPAECAVPDGGVMLLDGGTACSTLDACCSQLMGTIQTECQNIGGGTDETQCTNLLALVQGRGQCL